jgi:hypothetical protein
MFNFRRKSGMLRPSASILRALEAVRLPPGTDPANLGVLESRASYSGRKVTLIRIFDPKRAAMHSADVFTNYTYADLDAHLDLILCSGHIEKDGTVVLSAQAASQEAQVLERQPADRAAHADDEKFVFQDKTR